ncbi:hypothetical protein QAD02_005050 [Eretmocerus hayati]|uniref:Uncharacterized protein n=1 Tax=Eretmocerus hayati TaxID=131215 RepID=A0ACC2NSJ7_9HYME|nr:hypothetical protein QAD02_005050 [Eretmocerus hayati]
MCFSIVPASIQTEYNREYAKIAFRAFTTVTLAVVGAPEPPESCNTMERPQSPILGGFRRKKMMEKQERHAVSAVASPPKATLGTTDISGTSKACPIQNSSIDSDSTHYSPPESQLLDPESESMNFY